MLFKTLLPLYLILALSHICHGQSKLSGLVTDQNHLPLPGVILHIEQSQYSLSTDLSGNFAFYKLKDGLIKVHCRLMGYKDTTVQINMIGATTLKTQLRAKPLFFMVRLEEFESPAF